MPRIKDKMRKANIESEFLPFRAELAHELAPGIFVHDPINPYFLQSSKVYIGCTEKEVG
jgi:hypothetical protein